MKKIIPASAFAISMLFFMASCVPISKDRYYEATYLGQPSKNVRAGDIVGTWYDAYNWNGHEYQYAMDIKADGTGQMMTENKWREGGGMKCLSDLQWKYNGGGVWSFVQSNTRTLAGTGRHSSKPFPFTVRYLGGRIYNDTAKRTWVKGSDKSAVADKKQGMAWEGEARQKSLQDTRELGNSLTELGQLLQQ